MSNAGALLCARYAASPNFYGYCGPDKSNTILQHLHENLEDGETASILSEFETLFPYLEMIAQKNDVRDYFDPRVVEAYWIGNSLLHGFSTQEYIAFLREKLQLEHTLPQDAFIAVMKRMRSLAPLPFHAFHVFTIFKRTGHVPVEHTLQTMDSCRISWGKVISVKNGQNAQVLSRPLMTKDGKLLLGEEKIITVILVYGKNHTGKEVVVDDWISFHWGLMCDRITLNQVKQLQYYTELSIRLANL